MCFPANPIEIDSNGVPHVTKKRLGKILDSRNIDVHDMPGHTPGMSLVVDV
jgi:glyoxylase-like metal-dependent hydrolase (beta-lactamase superfamily II)